MKFRFGLGDGTAEAEAAARAVGGQRNLKGGRSDHADGGLFVWDEILKLLRDADAVPGRLGGEGDCPVQE